MGKMELSKCEKEVMEILYSAETELNLEEIKNTVNTRYEHQWKQQTVATFVARLTKKGWLSKEKKGKYYYYKPARAKHELKIRPPYYAVVANGIKTFEIRKDDRGFKTGDIVILKEWDGAEYTGKEIHAEIKYILGDEFVGLSEGYVAFSIGVFKIVN